MTELKPNARFYKFVDWLHRRQKLELDAVFLVESKEGYGKSVCCYWILKLLAEMDGVEFNIEKSLLINQEDLINALTSWEDFSKVWMDEAITFLYNRQSNTSERAELNSIFTRIREKKYGVGMCCPRIGMLDEYYREHRIAARIKVGWRGTATVYMPDKNVEVGDPWWLKEPKIRDKSYKRRKGGTYWGVIKYPDMPPEDKEIYQKIKAEQMKIGRHDENLMLKGELSATRWLSISTEYEKDELLEYIHSLKPREKVFSLERVAKLTDVSPSTVRTQIQKIRTSKLLDVLIEKKETIATKEETVEIET